MTGNSRDCDPTDPRAARFCAYGALIRSAFELTGDREQAHRLAGQIAMSITAQSSPDEAFEQLYSINDGPAVPSRKAIAALFEKNLALV